MNKIVVGVDGSESSRQALVWAATEAEIHRSEVVVVQSWHEPVLGGPGFSATYETDMVIGDAKRELDAVAQSVHDEHPAVHVSSVLTDGHPAGALVKRADGVDLVVVGARGKGGFLGLELGSVSAKVARRASVPTVVVRGEHGCSGRPTVVVGVDGSTCSRRALRWAADWAKAHDKALRIVMAWNFLEPQGPHGPIKMQPTYEAQDAVAALDEIVTDVLGPWDNPRITKQTPCDLPARAVLERADDACLIVVGRHGTPHWSPPDFGATALQVLHHAACPVAIIPELDQEPAPGEPSS